MKYLILPSLLVSLATPIAAQPIEPLQSFVTGQFYHGLPRQQAEQYGPEAVPELLAMLENIEFERSWHQIIDMLSIVGDGRATPDLVNFLENRFEGNITLDTFRALTQVPRSVGMIAARGDREAQAWLERGLLPENWSETQLKWSLPTLNTVDQRVLMSELNISGLSMVGTRSSLSKLREVRGILDSRIELRPALAPVLREAIATNELILERGPEIMKLPQIDSLIRDRVRDLQ